MIDLYLLCLMASATTAIAFSTNNALGTTTYSWTNSDPSIGLAASGGTSAIPAFVTSNTGNKKNIKTNVFSTNKKDRYNSKR